MARTSNKAKMPQDIDAEMQKLQQEIHARNAKLEALQQQKAEILAAAKCTFFDMLQVGAAKDEQLAKALLAIADKATGEKKKTISVLIEQLREAITPTKTVAEDKPNEFTSESNQSLTEAELEEREIERMLAEEEAQNAPVNSVQTQPQAS